MSTKPDMLLKKICQPALCKLCDIILISSTALQTHIVTEHETESENKNDDEIEQEIKRLFEGSEKSETHKDLKKEETEEEDILEEIEDFLKFSESHDIENDKESPTHEHDYNMGQIGDVAVFDNETLTDEKDAENKLNEENSWTKLIEKVSDHFKTQYENNKLESKTRLADNKQYKIVQPAKELKLTKNEVYKERLQRAREQKMEKLKTYKEQKLKEREAQKQERIEAHDREAEIKKKLYAMKLEITQQEKQCKIEEERRARQKVIAEKKAELKNTIDLKRSEIKNMTMKSKKSGRLHANEIQKITPTFDGEKYMYVPAKRDTKIEDVVEYRAREYKNDFTEYFMGSENLNIKQSNGDLSSNSKTSKDAIQHLAEKVLTEGGNAVDTEQKKALRELYRPTKIRLLPCKLCSKSFNQWSSLQHHNKIDHEKRLTTACKLCKIVFATPDLHSEHRLLVHRKIQTKDIQCQFCENFFANNKIYNKHINGVHNGVVTKCKICDKTFSFRENMMRHMRQVHTDIQPFQCSFCNRFFGDSGNLKRHIRGTHFKIRIPCPICNKPCWDKANMKHHIKEKHSGPLICPQCGKDFLSIDGMKIHQNKYHLETPTEYPCTECSYTFLTPQDRLAHKKKVHIVTEQTIFNCRYCLEKFHSKSEKEEHSKTHPQTESYKFPCRYCGQMKSTEIRRNLHETECPKSKNIST